MIRSQLIGYGCRILNFVLLEEGLQDILTLFLYLTTVAAQDGLYLCLCLCRGYEINPRSLYMLCLGGEDFHLVTAVKLMTQGYELVIHLGSDTVGT